MPESDITSVSLLWRNRFLFAENEKIIRILKHPDIFALSSIILVYSGKSFVYSISIEGTENMKYNKHNETETLKKHTEGSAENGRILGFHLRKIINDRQLCRVRRSFGFAGAAEPILFLTYGSRKASGQTAVSGA